MFFTIKGPNSVRDSNLVFDIAGHTLLFERSEFCLVTGFAYGKVVFPEYIDDGIPPFLRRVFPEKVKNLENKTSLGKAEQGKAAKGKAAKVKAAKSKAAKRKAAQGKAAQPSDKGNTYSMRILYLRSLIWDDEMWKKLSVEDSIRVCLLYMSEQIFMGQEDKKVVNNSFLRDTHINFKKKNPSKLPTYSIYGFAWAFKVWILESFPNSYHWWSKESELIPRSEQVVDRNGFTRDDEPKAKQDGSGASDRASAGAKVEETKSTREVALEEELDLLKSRYVELESYYKNLEASVEIAQKNSPGLSLPTPNAKATSVCDDIDEADAAADDNAKATRVCDDIDEADAATDDNVKATSVHDDVGVPDAAADDNAKATSVHDDVGVPDAAADDNAKATSVHDDVGVPDAATDDNAKATSVHDDVGVPDAAVDDNAKKDTELEVTVVKKPKKKRMGNNKENYLRPLECVQKTHSGGVVPALDNGEA
ncbi:hypothetical protein Tco_0914978 [Tanacetum coccineum]